jgi:ATP-binding cassette subfamily B (MDR/TAP) protein 1
LQEVNKESEQALDDQNKSEITVESGRHSSQRMSIPRSISRGSSGAGNSSRRSFSVSFGLPTGVNGPDIAWAEQENPPLSTEKTPKVSLRRLAYLNKPEIPVLIIGAIAAIINGLIFPIFGLLISSVIKTFFEPPAELKKDSKFWAIMFMVLGLISLLVIPARSYFFAVAGCKLIQRIRVMCFEKVVHMEVGWFDEPEHSSGTIGARLSADAASVRALVGDALGMMVENASSAVAGLVIAFVASWQLALIILVLIPLIGLNGFVQVKFMKGFSADAKVCSNTTASAIHDSSMLSIKHFHLKKNEEKSSNFVQDLGEKYLKTPRYC